MAKTMKYGVIVGSLGNVGDRYTLGGYKPGPMTFRNHLEYLSTIDLLDGIEIFEGNLEGQSIPEFAKMVKSYNLEVAAVGVDLSGDPKWRYGTLISKDAKIRAQAVDVCLKAVDIAKGTNCDRVNIWLAQDGFDYPFQVDFSDQWNYMVDSVQKIADRDPGIRIGLEPKPREPRNRCFIDSVPTALLIADETKRPNVGVTIDVGHVLVEFRNMAQAVATAARRQRLFHLHINDNYGGWDDDMIVGSVRQIEFLELFYHLRKLGYNGWCSVDIFPYREDSRKAVEESIKYMAKFEEMIDNIGMAAIGECLKGDDVAQSIRLLREKIYR